MPLDIWGATALGTLILILTAIIDAFTARIPDAVIFPGLIAVIALQTIGASWTLAAMNLGHGIEAGLLIWAVNALWYKSFRHDALGMGDAKWTMLAAVCFGLAPCLIAWGFGACLAVAWITAARLARRRVTRVAFAPFLLIGLGLGFYWARFAGAAASLGK